MLMIRHLSKTYDNGVRALAGVNLDVPRGLFGLLGPNGAGKSSLMRTLATLQDPDTGTATLDGLDLLGRKAAVRRILGYLPQDFGLYPRIDALTLLDHFARLKGISRRDERRQAVETLLRLTHLWSVRERKLGTFSGGMRQRFGIAQALLGAPRLIIVDEPTAGLDPEERRRFLNLLAEIGRDAVVLLSTHMVADVRELCTAMAVIDRGEVLLEGRPDDLIASLAGTIWRAEDAAADPASLPARCTLLSTHLVGGRTVARVWAPDRPGPAFEPAEPNLEDVYFRTLRGDAPPSG